MSADGQFVVVLPFYSKDALLAAKSVAWMAELGTPKTHDILLSHERDTDPSLVVHIHELAAKSFKQVHRHSYAQRYPACNEAWAAAALQMMNERRNWLWMEPDAVALNPNWLTALQERYDQAGCKFAGPIVPGMGHMNGTGIYPFDTPHICPQATRAPPAHAWDMAMKPEMIHLCHDCSDLWQHAWVEVNGQLLPHGDGVKPTFPTHNSVGRLSPSAVTFHRNSDGTLIDRMREMRK